MTREDAIKIFNTVLLFGKCDCPKEEIEECLKMAIKALEQEPTTKNDLGVDCISRAEAIKCLECDFDITGKENMKTVVNYINSAHDKIVNLPRVKQNLFKPMVEIDLYSVIKQKYIEREVLDKIRAEIDNALSDGMIHKKTVLGIIDKYKAETEVDNGNNNH